MDAQRAREICGLVLGVIDADGKYDPSEHALLQRLRARLGLSAHGDSPETPALTGDEAARALRELPEAVRFETFDLLIDAAVVDGEVDPAERRYLEVVSAAVGATPEQLERHIAQRLTTR